MEVNFHYYANIVHFFPRDVGDIMATERQVQVAVTFRKPFYRDADACNGRSVKQSSALESEPTETFFIA